MTYLFIFYKNRGKRNELRHADEFATYDQAERWGAEQGFEELVVPETEARQRKRTH